MRLDQIEFKPREKERYFDYALLPLPDGTTLYIEHAVGSTDKYGDYYLVGILPFPAASPEAASPKAASPKAASQVPWHGPDAIPNWRCDGALAAQAVIYEIMKAFPNAPSNHQATAPRNDVV